jgi:hypothetical protein
MPTGFLCFDARQNISQCREGIPHCLKRELGNWTQKYGVLSGLRPHIFLQTRQHKYAEGVGNNDTWTWNIDMEYEDMEY